MLNSKMGLVGLCMVVLIALASPSSSVSADTTGKIFLIPTKIDNGQNSRGDLQDSGVVVSARSDAKTIAGRLGGGRDEEVEPGVDCERDPDHEACGGEEEEEPPVDCERFPDDASCGGEKDDTMATYCAANPSSSVCQSLGKFCAVFPDSSDCVVPEREVDPCVEDPRAPGCR